MGSSVGCEVVGDLVGKCQTGCGAGVSLWGCTGFDGSGVGVGNAVKRSTVGLIPS